MAHAVTTRRIHKAQGRIASLLLPKGYWVERANPLDRLHYVPGSLYVVRGAAWGLRSGFGSFGSGRTVAGAVNAALAFFAEEARHG